MDFSHSHLIFRVLSEYTLMQINSRKILHYDYGI